MPTTPLIESQLEEDAMLNRIVGKSVRFAKTAPLFYLRKGYDLAQKGAESVPSVIGRPSDIVKYQTGFGTDYRSELEQADKWGMMKMYQMLAAFNRNLNFDEFNKSADKSSNDLLALKKEELRASKNPELIAALEKKGLLKVSRMPASGPRAVTSRDVLLESNIGDFGDAGAFNHG